MEKTINKRHYECLRIMLREAEKGTWMARTTINEALCAATALGSAECCKIVLASPSADINARDSCGYTALMVSAMYNRQNSCEYLLSVPSINVNERGPHGETALMIAASPGSEACCRLLVAAPSTDVNATDDHGLTALIHAYDWCKSDAIIEMLFNAK